MDISGVAEGNNDLARFISFLNHIENIEVIKDDWDHMCGITIATTFAGTKNTSICFNFYQDGKYRCIVDASDENQKELYKRSRDKEFKYASLWDILKIWWQAKKS